MPELQHQGSSRLLAAPGASGGNPDDTVTSLASSFKDKVKIEKKHGSSEKQPDQKKKVMVEEGGKKKPTGGKSNKKSIMTANLVSVPLIITDIHKMINQQRHRYEVKLFSATLRENIQQFEFDIDIARA